MGAWEPGDVAMVNDTTGGPEHVAICTAPGATGEARWNYGRGDVWSSVSIARPLVIIDAEDRGHVERLDAVYQSALDAATPFDSLRDVMQAALREFADPKPLKPEEPTGLGAVVRDAEYKTWVRHEPDNGRQGSPDWCWVRTGFVGAQSRRPWSEIDAVEILSPGWSE
jgi:hypothetical protein